MQNTILAPLMLIVWFPISLLLFRFIPRPALAASISIVGAGLLLPSGYEFDFAAVPPIGRETVAVLACAVAVGASQRQRLAARKPLTGAEALALVLIVTAFGTVVTNRDPLPVGPRELQALKLWDVFDVSARAVFSYLIPYYLGRSLFRHPRELQVLLKVLAIAGLLYSVPILWEVRMSPGLHHFIYGYHPASFVMAGRELFFGWRPMVLVGHGLSLSMFMLTSALGAATLLRRGPNEESPPWAAGIGYLGFMVLLCNSIGTIVYAMVTVPLVALASSGVLRRILVAGSLLVFLYPTVRATNIFPANGLVQLASLYSPERAASLKYRFDNEDLLLAKARDRVAFGWGGYARGRVYDLETGDDLTVTDGYWIIVLGAQGVFGFLAIFGMLLLPVFGAIRATAGRLPSTDVYLVLGTGLIVLISAIDLLPNGAPTIRTVFAAGALAGALQGWNQFDRARLRRAGNPRCLPVQSGPRRQPAEVGAWGVPY